MNTTQCFLEGLCIVVLWKSFFHFLKGIIHLKMKKKKKKKTVIIHSPSSFFKLVWISFFCWTQREIFWWMSATRQLMNPIDFHSRKKKTMNINGYWHSSKYLPLCSAEERHSYRLETTWGWVNYDRIIFSFFFKWTIPLTSLSHFHPLAQLKCYDLLLGQAF